ncbi:UNVERIFIED_CONTAM: hypothetical protein GTU68_011811 [Idotea baltica]|nr:hypothetical protein [Idotea baltica]
MMPRMNGVDLLKTIKNHDVYNHIPCLMLTAKASEEDLLTGLSSGADAYMSKPFLPKELLLRVENLLQLLKNQRSGTLANAMIRNVQSEDPDTQIEFLDHINKIILANLGDSDFKVTNLCTELNTNQTSLNKRMRLLTGVSMSGYIRKYRMSHAKKLLATTDQSISTVCYHVGISDPAYFTKLYKKEYGVLPSEARDI